MVCHAAWVLACEFSVPPLASSHLHVVTLYTTLRETSSPADSVLALGLLESKKSDSRTSSRAPARGPGLLRFRLWSLRILSSGLLSWKDNSRFFFFLGGGGDPPPLLPPPLPLSPPAPFPPPAPSLLRFGPESCRRHRPHARLGDGRIDSSNPSNLSRRHRAMITEKALYPG